MSVHIGNDWDEILSDQWSQPYYQELRKLLLAECRQYTVYPPVDRIFYALQKVSYQDCKVVILGQDPYHGPNQANGLCFSVARGVDIPPSLVNIYKELAADLDCAIPKHGDLTKWADQGILLLNSSLTVRAHAPNSHAQIGWTVLTNTIIRRLGKREKPLCFVLWGRFAQNKRGLIQNRESLILEAPHPSPLSAHRGFFGSRPFSKINQFLSAHGQTPIDWQIEDDTGRESV
ncbi:MAG: uracil-DNA glycosylase [Ndongobacter sp.]|nr:uracil-DNA glycosylase [Ndongobacter sp.]